MQYVKCSSQKVVLYKLLFKFFEALEDEEKLILISMDAEFE